MQQPATKGHPHRKLDLGNDESAEMCPRSGDVIPLSQAAEEHYCCCNPICSSCNNEAECRGLAGHLSSRH